MDMTLDDLIKNNKKSGGGAGGNFRGRGRGSGPARRFPNRAVNRAAPYTVAKAPEPSWNPGLFAVDQVIAYPGQVDPRASSIETGTKLYISNLDYGVSNDDIKELFSEVGDLKRYTIHYDKSGRSKGTAEVVFSRRQDAVSAVKRYNNVQLDGKPMKIEIVGSNIVIPAAAPPPANIIFGNQNGIPRSVQGRGGGFGRSRGGGGSGPAGGRGFGRGRGRGGGGQGTGEKKSAEDLDAELEKYHAEAMETN